MKPPVVLDHLPDGIALAAGLGLLRGRIAAFGGGHERLAGAGGLEAPSTGVRTEGQPALDVVDAVEEAEALVAFLGDPEAEPWKESVEVLDASRWRRAHPFTVLVRERRGRHGEIPVSRPGYHGVPQRTV